MMIFIIGLCGMFYALYGQSLLVLGKISFSQSLKYISSGVAIGVWLIIISLVASRLYLIPSMLGWLGVIAGSGYVLTTVAFLKVGSKHLLFYIGSFIMGISYPIWAIWFGLILS